jgi:dCMP deaminase
MEEKSPIEAKIHNSSNLKRKNYLSWDETFMQMSYLIAQRSKDPNTQVGACVVDENNVIVGLGYNGFPRGCSDDNLPWGRERELKLSETKYAYVVHAEVNAIYNANKSVEGCKLYCYLFPCNECAKTIIQTGIKEIIYAVDFYHNEEQCIASRRMLDLAGIKCRQYVPQNNLQEILCPGEKKQHTENKLENAQLNSVKKEIKPEEKKQESMQETINFQDNSPTFRKPENDEPSQFIFENIPMD